MSIYNSRINKSDCQEDLTNGSKTVSTLLLIQNAACDQQLTDFSCRVLIRLLSHFNHKTGLCNPSEKLLAEALGVCKRSVASAIKQLKDHGWIYLQHQFRNSNHYSFNWSKAVKIDLRKNRKPSDGSPEVQQVASLNENEKCKILPSEVQDSAPLTDIERCKILPSEVQNPSIRSAKSFHLEVQDSAHKPIEGNILNQPTESTHQSGVKKDSISVSSRYSSSTQEDTNKDFISHNFSSKEADAGDIPTDAGDDIAVHFDRYIAVCSNDFFSKETAAEAFCAEVKAGADAEEMINARVNYEKTVRGKEQRWIKRPDLFLSDQGFWKSYCVPVVKANDPKIEEVIRQQNDEASSKHYQKMMGLLTADVLRETVAVNSVYRAADDETLKSCIDDYLQDNPQQQQQPLEASW